MAVATSSSSKEKTLEKAEKFFTKDKYEKALKVYAKLMNDSTIDNHILYKTGLCYYGLSAYSAAIIFLERSIENTENIIPEAEYFLGKSYDGDNKPSKAIPHFYKFEEMLKVLAEVKPENALKFQELAIALNVEIELCKSKVENEYLKKINESADSSAYFLLTNENEQEDNSTTKILNKDVYSSNGTKNKFLLFTFLNLPQDSILSMSLPNSITIEEEEQKKTTEPPLPVEIIESNEVKTSEANLSTEETGTTKKYTIQVGAFDRMPSQEFLFSIENLNSHVTPTGLIKYTLGSFTEKESAAKYRDELIQSGFTGAFIISIQ
ncbi:MAG: hypothetical protein HRT72_04785 [Flavobacteriales bacterium]|nr:hypothetical protein [Flavobacteriales bacterium]